MYYSDSTGAARHRRHHDNRRVLVNRRSLHGSRRGSSISEQLIEMEIEAWARRAARSNGFGAPEAAWFGD
jgi:hypothetical protein